MTTRISLLIFTFLLSSQTTTGQCNPTLSGTVINESGDPVPGASITVVDEAGSRGFRHTFIEHETDRNGAFNFAVNLDAPGKVWLYAKKKADGYPDTLISFYNEDDVAPIVLDCESYKSGVIIKLGPKAGYIGKITVTDAVTGKPIYAASIALRREVQNIPRIAKFDVFIKSNTSKPNIEVPSDVGITYEISAPGYVPSKRKTLHLRPLEKIDISEQLSPSPPNQGESR